MVNLRLDPARPKRRLGLSSTCVVLEDLKKCATCHEQITNEWRSSMHGRSASDKAFQTNVACANTKKRHYRYTFTVLAAMARLPY